MHPDGRSALKRRIDEDLKSFAFGALAHETYGNIAQEQGRLKWSCRC